MPKDCFMALLFCTFIYIHGLGSFICTALLLSLLNGLEFLFTIEFFQNNTPVVIAAVPLHMPVQHVHLLEI